MNMIKNLSAILVVCLFSAGAYAEHHGHHDVKISNAVVGATPLGVKNGAIYFTIENSMNKDLMILSAETGNAVVAELHEHTVVDGAMSMRQVTSVHLPAKKKVMFQPGGLHVMLFGLETPLVAGEQTSVTLNLNNGEQVHVVADIVMPGDINSNHVSKKGMSDDSSNHKQEGHKHH